MNIKWWISRAFRMSPPELVFRVHEFGKKLHDSQLAWGWRCYGNFGGPVSPLACLAQQPDELGRSHLRERAQQSTERSIRYFGQNWPVFPSAWNDVLWHVDPVTGRNWPGRGVFAFRVQYRDAPDFGDVKFVWELNRLQFLQAVAAVAAKDGDEDAWQFVREVLKSWARANPPFDGVNWCSGIEVASRIISFLSVYSYASRAEQIELLGLLRRLVEAHAFWLSRYPSKYSSANNHRVAELAALFLAGLAMPQMPGAGAYVAQAQGNLEDEVRRQFFPDGVGAEQSLTYSAYTLEWCVLSGLAGDAFGRPFSKQYRDRITLAERFLRCALDDRGCAPRIGDDDEGHVLEASFGSGDQYVRRMADAAANWVHDTTAEPLSGVKTFRHGGYTIFRKPTAHGLLLALFDHGPLGYLSIAAHGHADALSFWLHLGEEPVFIDAGTYLYHAGGAWRDRLRGTPVHNTLTVELADQSEIGGPFAWSRHASTEIVLAGESEIVAQSDGFEKRFGVCHQRGVSMDEGFLIEDRLLGTPRRANLAWSIGFTLSPTVRCSIDRNVVFLTTAAGRELTLTQLGPSKEWISTRVSISPCFNRMEHTTRLTIQGVAGHGGEVLSRVRIEPHGF